MDGGQQAKQQIVERLKNTNNILITVSTNPSVDELSAALALTMMLNKLKKQATAVFSGAIPPAIQFLEPEKTFEGTVDSLRDFIVALDKQKAGRIKYKVDGNMVRIFITPYRTVITQKDLEFSQGDFNVETIVALGVERREEIDKAITAHGRILHDATVVTISARNESNNLGSIDWQEGHVSSLSEMLMNLSDDLEPDLLDQQIATALLTGIVAATGRFSNQKTTPRVMTMAAQLMAAGANQQLIAAKLQDRKLPDNQNPAKTDQSNDKADDDGTVVQLRGDEPQDGPTTGSSDLSGGVSSDKPTTKDNRLSQNEAAKSERQPNQRSDRNQRNNRNSNDNTQPKNSDKFSSESSKADKTSQPAKKKANGLGEIEISHDDGKSLPAAFQAAATAGASTDYALHADEIAEKRRQEALAEAERELAAALPAVEQAPGLPPLEQIERQLDEARDQAPAPTEHIAEPVAEPVVAAEPAAPAEPTPAAELPPLPPAPATPDESAPLPSISSSHTDAMTAKPEWMQREITEPSLGGSLNATTEQAVEDRARAEDDENRRNHTILNHEAGQDSRPVTPVTLPEPNPIAPSTMPRQPEVSAEPAASAAASLPQPAELPEPAEPLAPVAPMVAPPELPPLPTAEPAVDAARQAVDSALAAPLSNEQPFSGAVPTLGQPTLPDMPGLASEYEATPLPPPPAVPTVEPQAVETPAIAPAPVMAPPTAMPGLPEVPTLGGLPPLPPLPNDQALPVMPSADVQPPLPPLPAPEAAPTSSPAPAAPGQFRIPGQ